MDRATLASVDDGLRSSEVAALCFLCRDVLHKKALETVQDGRDLFKLLENKDLLRNPNFLSQLLKTIKRADLLGLLEADGTQVDSSPLLSDYRVTLYNIYDDMTAMTLKRMKFLLPCIEMGRGQIEHCNTALDVFALMEGSGLLSRQQLSPLRDILLECDTKLSLMLQTYMNGVSTSPPTPSSDQPTGDQDIPHVSMDNQRDQRPEEPAACSLSVPEMSSPSNTPHASRAPSSLTADCDPDYEPMSSLLQQDFYELKFNPRGKCVVFNNEMFSGGELRNRPGTQKDVDSLCHVFERLGFCVNVYSNLTASAMRRELEELGKQTFIAADVLVVCVLSHGELECVFGTDGLKVTLAELRSPFTSKRAPTLAGKPKLFFIQACQGSGYQQGAAPCPPRPQEESRGASLTLEEDAGPLPVKLVAEDADFLMGMATVEECKSFRNTNTGSIFIQELCKQLLVSAKSKVDLLTTLTRVNREVSKGEYLSFKQMPQPKYTLTKMLVLTELKVIHR